jgi:hypothetical protein
MSTETQDRRRRAPPGGRRLLAALAVAAAVVVVVVTVLLLRDDEPGPGPLETYASDSLTFPVYAGRTFTYAQTVVINSGEKPATLIAATPFELSDGLAVENTLVAGSRRLRMGMAGDRVFPPTFDKLTDLRPLNGYQLAPASTTDGRRGVELVFALRAAEPGRYEFRGIQLEYEIDGKRYREVLPNALAACAARSRLGAVKDCREAERADPPKD